MPDRSLSEYSFLRDPAYLRAAAQDLLADTSSAGGTAPQTPTPRSKRLFRSLGLPILVGGQLADGVSTVRALGREGTQERNTTLYGAHPSAGRVLGTKAAVTAPMAVLLDRVAEDHPKLALALALGVGGVGFGAAAHNARQGRRR